MKYYKIKIKERLDKRWEKTFEDWEMKTVEQITVLSGGVPDQAALHGVLNRLRDLNVTIISIDQINHKQEDKE